MKITEVAAGILIRPNGTFLLASRPAGKPYAGYWEFPGGKLEAGETAHDALVRELQEEMGITVTAATPWLMQTFRYPHATVRLQFFLVTAWSGQLHPHEDQAFAWQRLGEIRVSPILPANGPILRGLALPDQLAFSNVAELGEDVFLQKLNARIALEPVWLVLREPQLGKEELSRLAATVIPAVQKAGGKIILHGQAELAQELGADGVHLSSRQLCQLKKRPQGLDWVGASTHNHAQLACVRELGLDYAVLGHVAPTRSHPDQAPLGWDSFAALLREGWPFPVFAIGGMDASHIPQARALGAHGIASLRAFWQSA
jgi:8-oxo-dGTP diphosphatase